MIILFIGASGSGKDTHAKKLASDFGFEVISTGQLLRDISEDGKTKLQRIIRHAMDKGFASNRLVHGLLEHYIRGMEEEEVKEHFILTGAVRRHKQVSLLDGTLSNIDRKLDKVIYFDIDDKTVHERLGGRRVCKDCGNNHHLTFMPPKVDGICDKCGGELYQREDDNPKSIEIRLNSFYEHSESIINEYKSRGILETIDASQDIDGIYAQIKAKLDLE